MIRLTGLSAAIWTCFATCAFAGETFPVDWYAMAGIRVYQHRATDKKDFQAQGRESYFSVHWDPVPAAPVSLGLGYLFVDFSTADWKAPGQEVILRSPVLELMLSPFQTEDFHLFIRGRWLRWGKLHWSFPEPTGQAEQISLEGQHFSMGAGLQLTPLASLLFEIAKGIEYTFDSITGEQTSLKPLTLLTGFRVGLNAPR